ADATHRTAAGPFEPRRFARLARPALFPGGGRARLVRPDMGFGRDCHSTVTALSQLAARLDSMQPGAATQQAFELRAHAWRAEAEVSSLALTTKTDRRSTTTHAPMFALVGRAHPHPKRGEPWLVRFLKDPRLPDVHGFLAHLIHLF